MRLDSGVLDLYEFDLTSEPGDMPNGEWRVLWSSYYGEKTVGVTRFYTGLANNDRTDLLVRVQRNPYISAAAHRVKLRGGDDWYRITQVQHILDDDGLEMSELALERTGKVTPIQERSGDE